MQTTTTAAELVAGDTVTFPDHPGRAHIVEDVEHRVGGRTWLLFVPILKNGSHGRVRHQRTLLSDDVVQVMHREVSA